jgi:hypothetical protein
MLNLELRIVFEILMLLGMALSAFWGLCVLIAKAAARLAKKYGPEVIKKVVIDLVSAALLGVIVILITRDPTKTSGASLAGYAMSHFIQKAIS